MAIKRLHYFDHQFLVEPDFTDEQKYHLDMRRRLNRLLHTFGIAEGLEVVKKTSKIVTVKSGVAIDRLGREMVLEADQDVDLSLITTAVPAFITIAYQEQQTDPSTATGAPGNTRFTEQPILQATTTPPPTDGTVIRLASITLAAGGTVPDAFDGGVRKRPSSVIDPGSDLAVRSLALTDLSLPSNQWPSLRLGAANRADLTGSLHVSGDGSVGGKVGIGTTTPPQQLSITGGIGFANQNAADKKLYSPADGVLEWMTHDAAGQHGFAVSHQGQQRVFLNTSGISHFSGGNVGIGTTAPKAKLEVSGGAIMPAAGNSESAGIMFPRDPGGGAADAAWIRYYPRAGEATTLELGTSNDADDHIALMASGNVGIGTANPGAKLDVVGSIRSTMWNVFTVLNQQPGALPLNRQFTSNGGTLLLFASGSGFLAAGGGQIGMEVVIDNVVRATARGFTNEALSHKAFTTSAVVVILIGAGQHNLSVRTMPNTVTDFNDFFTVTILELPWVQPFIFTPIPIVIPIGP